MKKEAIIDFQDFGFQYFSQAEPTLSQINLKIYPGEKVLIIGPSGSGKSTLGHCLNGLIPFSYKGDIRGSLKIKGKESKDQTIFDLAKVIGTVLQDSDGQFVGLTVAEDIAFALENDNVSSPVMHDRVRQVAQMVDMDRFLASSPYEISGGQKQRTALAGVLIDDVEVLLFDEPLANLDPYTGKRAIEIIDQIHKESHKTIIIIEHRLEDVLHCHVDRVIMVNNGRILADLSPDYLVASSILKENGIREPLYITALKYAGVEISPDMTAGQLASLKLKGRQDQLKDWNNSIHQEKSENTNPSILRLEDISFAYIAGRPILEKITFDIKAGEMLAIVGKNGAGKSTISKLICGFEKEGAGNIYYQGKNMKDLTIKERAERIGLVMQNPNQMISKAMIYDEVALGLRLRGVDEDQIKHRVDKILKICGLSPFVDWPISALSYGQKKRVTIAAILVLEPKVIILDEPTAGQDYRHYSEIMDFLKEINRMGITILFITHDMHLMLEYTQRAIVLANKKIVADTRPALVLSDSRVISEANLKETSLYTLANMAGLEDPGGFVQNFIAYERWVKIKDDQ